MFPPGINPEMCLVLHKVREGELLREARIARHLEQARGNGRRASYGLIARTGDLLVSLGLRLKARAATQHPELGSGAASQTYVSFSRMPSSGPLRAGS